MDPLAEISRTLHRYWKAFLDSVPRIGLAILVITVGVLLAIWIGNLLRRRLEGKAHDPLMGSFLGKAVKLVLIVAVLMLGLHAAGLSGIAGGILATAGASAIVVGFAFKDIAENFLAGIILSFSRPFHIHDAIKVLDFEGEVQDLSFRYTKIRTFDGRNVYIPNSDVITNPVTNYTGNGFYRWEFVVGIAYESDIPGALKVIGQCLDEHPGVVHDEQHRNVVLVDDLAASTVNLKVFFWVETADFKMGTLITKGELIRQIKERLEAAGYYLPNEIMELKLYGRGSEDFPVRLVKDA